MNKKVYMAFSTDIIHGGHISIINKAAKLGDLIIGVLADEVVASYKHFPLISCNERKEILLGIKGVKEVVIQNTLSYTDNLLKYKPDYLVHGDDWIVGYQKEIREDAIKTLKSYGGQLIEFPYSDQKKYKEIDENIKQKLSMPDFRRGRLKKILQMKKCIRIIEAHSGITGIIAEKTIVVKNGESNQFDGMWISSLCNSTVKGKPDMELVDLTNHIKTIDEIMEVTTKPIIFDGDTGGIIEHFVYTIKTLERIGVSAIIIEDKIGLKKNSLFGTDVIQTQDSVEKFCDKIQAGKKVLKTSDFMIIARIESLILEKGMDDALHRGFEYVKHGADGIMIHSKKNDPNEVLEFIDKFRQQDKITPIVVVPTTYNSITEEELAKRGANIIIYANQLMRSAFPAMQKCAQLILENHRAKETNELCMSVKEIINLIPEE